MQRAQIVKNVGYRVRLRPIACRLNELGLELPEIDDDWIIGPARDDGIPVSNIRTQHQFTLGFDHIHNFRSDTTRIEGDTKFGFLTLHVQINLQGANLDIQPTLRPGERVPPPMVKVVEKAVDIRYPHDSGLQGALEAQGYRLSWVRESRLQRLIDLEGWERVTTKAPDGSLIQFRLRDRPEDQVLICRC